MMTWISGPEGVILPHQTSIPMQDIAIDQHLVFIMMEAPATSSLPLVEIEGTMQVRLKKVDKRH
jgi:hypothetical protein